MSYLKEKKRESVLAKMCGNIVDVIHETFTRKYYLVRISQSKRGQIYLIVRKKRDGLLHEEKEELHRKIFHVVGSVFSWYCKRQQTT